MVRASAFPFQGALARFVSESRDASLLLVPLPAVIWAVRWMEPDIIPNVLTCQLLTAAVVLIPALLAWASRNDDAAKAYRLTSLMLWPMAFSMPTATAIGLIGLGTAATLCRPSSSWGLIASAASVVVPTLSILEMTRGGDLSSSHLVGWTAVSLSAFLMHHRDAPRSSPVRELGADDWREAMLVIVSLSTFLAPLLFGAAATAAP
jgi:hypothetical protein